MVLSHPVVRVVQRVGVLAIREDADARLLEGRRDGDVARALRLAGREVALCAGDDGARVTRLHGVEPRESATARGPACDAALEAGGPGAQPGLRGAAALGGPFAGAARAAGGLGAAFYVGGEAGAAVWDGLGVGDKWEGRGE